MTAPKLSANRIDVHQTITDQIVASIEAGADTFIMPWHRSHGSLARPVNVASGKRYQGINVLNLWIAGEARAYTAPIWGTYKQWQDKGAQVRKGEKASLIVFYKELEYAREVEDGASEGETDRVLFARPSWVFNASQVDGFILPAPEEFTPTIINPIETAERLVAATRATIREGGDRAYYHTHDDYVALPERTRFTGSATMTAQEAFYATQLHELTHWTGAKHRLDRDLSGRFGSESYAMEELVAELGASYLCADLGITTELRPDHASYIATWLKVLKEDKKAIFTAAAAAQKAASFLHGFLDDPTPEPPEDDTGAAPTRPSLG